MQHVLQQWNIDHFGKVNDRITRLRKQLNIIQTCPRTEDIVQQEAALANDLDEWLRREEILWHQSKQSIDKKKLQSYLSLVPRKVTDDHNHILLAPYTVDEITKALFQIHPEKAPGYDGFYAAFFQQNWEVLQSEFTYECLQFLNQGVFLAANNSTLITLIPKTKGASKVTEFRPISLTGILAKVVSKAITNRLQRFINEIICPEQCAFVKDRLITDNILIAHEVSHYINKSANQRQVYAALKLDMSKAYDMIEWDFLELLLLQLGFSELWVARVLSYVKGLRQGDPFSPYLFILCTEWLSSMLKHYADMGIIEGIKISRRSPAISHLMFADDCLIFMKINSSTITALRDVLQCYEMVSGQTLNYSKSEVAVSKNFPTNIRSDLAHTLGVPIVPHLSKYLGLPLQCHKKKTETYLPIIEKLQNRVHSWKNCKLSIGGKEVLISAVLNALPQYWLFFCCRSRLFKKFRASFILSGGVMGLLNEAYAGLNTKVIDSVWQKDWFTYCSRLLLHEKNWSIVLIRREANVAADSIARYFRCSGGQWTRLDAVPRLYFNVQSS
ncbi:hypothetical protein QQ045_018857 [Rhodiola kirilowii]